MEKTIKKLTKNHLTLAEAKVLICFLNNNKRMSVTEVMYNTHITYSHVYKTLDKLNEKGLIRRVRIKGKEQFRLFELDNESKFHIENFFLFLNHINKNMEHIKIKWEKNN